MRYGAQFGMSMILALVATAGTKMKPTPSDSGCWSA
jgi:hypothetical protein